MIEINLLPGARRSKSAARQPINFGELAAGVSGRLKDKVLIGTIAAVVVALAAVGYLYWSQTRQEETLTARHEKAVRDSTRYANFLKDRYKSEAVRDTLLRQVNIIRGLDEDRYVWPHVMDEISRALPQYTWLTLMSFAGTPQGQSNVVITPKTPQDTSAAAKKLNRPPKRLDTEIPKDQIQVRLVGRTVDIEALTRFMKDLESSPFLANVLLDKSGPALDNGKEVTEFQLTLNYTRPDTTFIHRVPLALTAAAGSR
ncbi:MAG TPA: PilN domain-containing protein [Gemmatimonadaceae bacterium]|nr:PilN domain-containing protein [Gemmatimonadaceae bacterium]